MGSLVNGPDLIETCNLINNKNWSLQRPAVPCVKNIGGANVAIFGQTLKIFNKILKTPCEEYVSISELETTGSVYYACVSNSIY